MLDEFHHLVAAGQHDEACRLLQQIDTHYLAEWGHYALLLELRTTLSGHLQQVDMDQRNWHGMGYVLNRIGRVREAIACFERSLDMATTIRDEAAISRACSLLGNAWLLVGETSTACIWYERTLAIARKRQNRQWEATALGNLGRVHAAQGHPQLAIELYEQARLLGTRPDRRWQGILESLHASACADLGEMHEAIRRYMSSLAIGVELGRRLSEGIDLGGLGLAWGALGEWHKAIDYLQRALEVLRGIGERPFEGLMLERLAAIFVQLERDEEAEAAWQSAISIAEEVGHAGDIASRKAGLAVLYLLQERWSDAAALVAGRGSAPSLWVQACLHHLRNRLDDAVAAYEQSLPYPHHWTRSPVLLGLAQKRCGHADAIRTIEYGLSIGSEDLYLVRLYHAAGRAALSGASSIPLTGRLARFCERLL